LSLKFIIYKTNISTSNIHNHTIACLPLHDLAEFCHIQTSYESNVTMLSPSRKGRTENLIPYTWHHRK